MEEKRSFTDLAGACVLALAATVDASNALTVAVNVATGGARALVAHELEVGLAGCTD